LWRHRPSAGQAGMSTCRSDTRCTIRHKPMSAFTAMARPGTAGRMASPSAGISASTGNLAASSMALGPMPAAQQQADGIQYMGPVAVENAVAGDVQSARRSGGRSDPALSDLWTLRSRRPRTTGATVLARQSVTLAMRRPARCGWCWVAGAGIEYAPVSWPSWSIRSEFLYASLRRQKTQVLCCDDFGGTPEPDFGFRFNDSVYIARLGLMYRWGGGYRAARQRVAACAIFRSAGEISTPKRSHQMMTLGYFATSTPAGIV
jgi:hypothetical protein